MSLDSDLDPEETIARLSVPLELEDRTPFRLAALEALAQILCPGPGAHYRAVSVLQRAYFVPPPDRETRWDVSRDLASLADSKQVHGLPPIGPVPGDPDYVHPRTLRAQQARAGK
jgi:hypothetical protein